MRKTLDDLHLLIKLILIIFVGPIYGAIYRIAGGELKNIIIGILWLITGGVFGIGVIVDLVTIILKGKPTILT